MSLSNKLDRAFTALRTGGPAALSRLVRWKISRSEEARRYQKWIVVRSTRRNAERAKIAADIDAMDAPPLISVLLPVYDVEERWLRKCIGSVARQVYPHWELCIADDCSPSPHIRRVLDELAAADARIKVVYRESNGHISAASNTALELAAGEMCVLLDHDDELSDDALYRVAKTLSESPDVQMIYSDEDMLDENGRRYMPKFKPNFSRDLLYSLNLVTHLSAYRTELLRSVGGFRLGFEGSQDYDLALRVLERIPESAVVHIPHVLYHWRAIRGSVAFGSDEKPYAHDRARKAIGEHLERGGTCAAVVEAAFNLHRVIYELPSPVPPVSIVVNAVRFSGDLASYLEKISSRTSYANFNVTAIGAEKYAGRSTAEALNAAVGESSASLICFLEAGLLPLDEGWLTELVRFASQPDIGAVGAKVSDGTGWVVTNGIILGVGGLFGDAHRGFPADEAGNMCRNIVAANYSAVSAVCMALSREAFEAVGGFDPHNYPNALFDIDLCLRLRERGLRIVTTPYAELQSKGDLKRESPGSEEEVRFRERWREQIDADRFYNPNLSRSRMFSVEI